MQNNASKTKFDDLETWPFPRRILWIIGSGFFFAFFDIITIGMALPEIEKQFHLSALSASWAVTSSLIGYIIGSFVVSRISDYFGRKPGLYISIALFSLGSLLTAFSFNLTWLIIWRFVTGMGIGSEIDGISTYMGELSPAKCRGKMTALAVTFGMFGFAAVPFVALSLVPHFSWGWRVLFVIGGLGGVIVFMMRRFIPESPRWLLAQGQTTAAQKILDRYQPDVLIHASQAPSNPKPYPACYIQNLNGHYCYLSRFGFFIISAITLG